MKVFIDYLMLKSGIDIDRLVVEYLFELVNVLLLDWWDDIMLRMFGLYLVGVIVDCKILIFFFLGL